MEKEKLQITNHKSQIVICELQFVIHLSKGKSHSVKKGRFGKKDTNCNDLCLVTSVTFFATVHTVKGRPFAIIQEVSVAPSYERTTLTSWKRTITL